jgi:hypothetical protein
MIKYNTEYFRNNCYFFLKDKGDKIDVYYSVADTLTESRKKDKKIVVDKKFEEKLKKAINKVLNSKEKVSKKEVDGELEELIDYDGTFLGSNIPFLNMTLTPHKTMDQTVSMARTTNDPITRGYRVYYGESKEKGGNLVNEIDYSEAFGYVETENSKSYDEASKILKKMGIEDDIERDDRLKKLGFSKKLDKSLAQEKKRGKCKNCFTKRRLSEKEYIEEERKNKAVKMVEDILTKKKTDDKEISKKENSGVSKILLKNLKAIKKIAEKEGISVSQLIKVLKTDE